MSVKDCNACMHSRLSISENGLHPKCILSSKKATACMLGTKNFYKCYAEIIERGKNEQSRRESGDVREGS